MKSVLKLLVVVCLFGLSWGTSANSVSIATVQQANPLAQVCVRVMREVYQRLGYSMEVQYGPAKRSFVDANNGKYDGELFRVASVARTHPNLIQIPVPICTLDAVVFSKSLRFPVSGWESLEPYLIGLMRGVQFASVGTEGMNREFSNNLDSLFRKLDAGRLDIVVESRFNGQFALQELGLAQSITQLTPPIARYDLFHYLHKDHSGLAEKLEAQLKEMEQDGSLQQLIYRSEQQVQLNHMNR
ncbi:substrate-binding periplasmic protein [Aliagarivorans marinus]|uniref:substrate-binding periplasmic protein n=1 Tax=Aliagarivorans marinus TaxID=561965 RepID=UPI00047E81DE|nr:transporter substrate-binding domain-containing protein [Aliagarivorans marinus]